MSRNSEWWLLGAVLLAMGFFASRSKEEPEEHVKLRPDWREPEEDSPVVEVVVPHLTPATFQEMMTAYVMAWREATGQMPSQRVLAMLLAHSALETGQWKEMWENNPANLTTTRNRGYYRLKDDTVHKYRPYKDRYAGALSHIVLLARRYPKALGLMLSGPDGVAQMLKDEGPFFESGVESYQRGLSALYAQFLPQVPGAVQT